MPTDHLFDLDSAMTSSTDQPFESMKYLSNGTLICIKSVDDAIGPIRGLERFREIRQACV
jgi:hypothetical protein